MCWELTDWDGDGDGVCGLGWIPTADQQYDTKPYLTRQVKQEGMFEGRAEMEAAMELATDGCGCAWVLGSGGGCIERRMN